MAGYRTVVRNAILQGTTPRITFQIVDEDGAGFQPDTLTMSIYDHVCEPEPGSNDFVNERDADDVLASCDSEGQVELWLESEDTEIADVTACDPTTITRRVLFRWTWSAGRIGKHEVTFTLAVDHETVAV